MFFSLNTQRKCGVPHVHPIEGSDKTRIRINEMELHTYALSLRRGYVPKAYLSREVVDTQEKERCSLSPYSLENCQIFN